jgi:hypothetical protein
MLLYTAYSMRNQIQEFVSSEIITTALRWHHYSAIIVYVISCAKLGSEQLGSEQIKLDLK